MRKLKREYWGTVLFILVSFSFFNIQEVAADEYTLESIGANGLEFLNQL